MGRAKKEIYNRAEKNPKATSVEKGVKSKPVSKKVGKQKVPKPALKG